MNKPETYHNVILSFQILGLDCPFNRRRTEVVILKENTSCYLDTIGFSRNDETNDDNNNCKAHRTHKRLNIIEIVKHFMY